MAQHPYAAGHNRLRSIPWGLLTGFGLGITLVALSLWMFAAIPRPNAAVSRNGNTVEFTLKDLSDKQVSLSDFRGRPVLVNFWATWCPPCRAEMPDLIAFQAQHQAEGLQFLAIDTNDERTPAEQFVRAHAMNFPVLYDSRGIVLATLGTDALPSTFLFDRSGHLVFQWTGQITAGVLEQRVVPFLKQ